MPGQGMKYLSSVILLILLASCSDNESDKATAVSDAGADVSVAAPESPIDAGSEAEAPVADVAVEASDSSADADSD